MAIPTANLVSLAQASATLSELADEARAGAERLFTKDGQSYVAPTTPSVLALLNLKNI